MAGFERLRTYMGGGVNTLEEMLSIGEILADAVDGELPALDHVAATKRVAALSKKTHIKTAVRTRININATPPITVHQVLVYAFSEHHINFYKRGGITVRAEDLTPVERGHVYEATFFADHVVLVTPFRLFDAESQQLVSGLHSLRNATGSIVKKYEHGKQNIHKGTAINDRFSLSRDEYLLFRERAMKMSCIVDEGDCSIETANSLWTKAKERIAGKQEALDALRKKADNQPIWGSDLAEDVYRQAASIQASAELAEQSLDEVKKSLTRVESLNAEDPDVLANVSLMRAQMSGVREAAQGVQKEARAICKHARKALTNPRVGSISPKDLGISLNEMAAIYPVMSRLTPYSEATKDGKTVYGLQVHVGGAVLFLHPDGRVHTEGDTTFLSKSALGPIHDGSMTATAAEDGVLNPGRFLDIGNDVGDEEDE